MAENSAISWTDHTFNPWWGCTKVGLGCDHCYAETFDRRVGGAHWGSGAPRRLVKDWSKPRKWDREAAKTGKRPWVFCASMADVFDNEVPTEWRERLWALVRECRNLNWIFVTKRIGNAAKMLPADWPETFPHCGLVITVVNQAEADRDIPKLLATPAAWRGLSMEPLLGAVDLTPEADSLYQRLSEWYGPNGFDETGSQPRQTRRQGWFPRLDWVIVGGESGHHARPMHPDWARGLRDQCAAAGVPFHLKQHGEFREFDTGSPVVEQVMSDTDHANSVLACAVNPSWVTTDGRHIVRESDLPEEGHAGARLIERVGKKAAGRLLDGVEHNGMPQNGAAPLVRAAE